MRVRVSAVLAVFLWGCSETAPDTDDDAIEGVTMVAAELSSEGGRLRLQSGVELKVPVDALGRPVKVEMEELAADDLARPARGETEGLALPCAFRPHGQKFEREVRVDWPIEELPEGHEVRVLRLDDEKDGEWEEVSELARLRPANELDAEERDRSGGRDVVELDLRGFSVYWIVSVPATDGDMEGPTTVDTSRNDGGSVDPKPDTSHDEEEDGGVSVGLDPCLDFACERGQVCHVVDGEPQCVSEDDGADSGTSGGGTDGGDGGSTATVDAGADAADGGAEATDGDGGTGDDAATGTGPDASEMDASPAN